MSDWKIIVPVATTNMVLNSSAEIGGNFAAVGGAVVSRQSSVQWIGNFAYKVEPAGNNQGVDFTLSALSNAIHYVTMRIFGTLPAAWDWSLDGVAFTAPTLITIYGDGWSLYGLQFSAAQANGSTTLSVYQNGAGSGNFRVDAIQVEEQTIYTTYCDGDQPGCEWNGAAHASTSTRSALSRAGGFIRDLKDDYYFGVIDVLGFGMPQLTVAVDGYAILPGGQLNSIKTNSRTGTLIGVFKDPTDAVGCDLHEMRQTLLEELAHDKYPKGALGWQPVILRYVGADVTKEIAVHYESGLEANIRLENRIHEKASIRFRAPDPFWYELGEESTALDTNDSATFRYVGGRLRSSGQWDDLNVTNLPGGPAFPNIHAIAISPIDKKIYYAGDFTNWNNVFQRDYITRYDPFSDSWETVGNAGDFNNVVRALVFGADGTLYAGGDFTNAGGVATADYVAQYDTATDTWSAVSGGGVISVRALAISKTGILYIGGTFLNWNGIGNADRIVQWDGSAYTALGTGMDSSVFGLAVNSDDVLYAAGLFTTAGGVAVNYVASWDGSAWSALDSSYFSSQTLVVEIDRSDNVYVGGGFANAGGDANADSIVKWNGTAYETLGTGVRSSIRKISIAPDEIVYVAGFITDAGGILVADGIAKWNGTSWAHIDISFAGTPDIVVETAVESDPVVPEIYDVWIGFDNTGTENYSGLVLISNSGTTPAWPKITINRSGGTTATLKQVRNETTGDSLLFDYSLLDGETLTINLDPTTGSIISSFFGPREDAILANSDRGQWAMQVGGNDVTAFVDVVGGPTITAFLVFKTPYKSFD